jgi:hypothetical protein
VTRATVLKLLGVAIAFRSLGNLFKRFGTGSGLVVFGALWPPDTLLAPILGMLMLLYGYGLWTQAAWALPLGIAYAVLATANLVLFPFVTGLPPRIPPWAYGVYGMAGLAFAWGSVWLLAQARRGAPA